MEEKKIKSIEHFDVYQKTITLFNSFVKEDLPLLKRNFVGKASTNQLRSLDSICTNMEEGYARKSGKDIKNFFRIARGSTGEARGRYKRFAHILSPQTITERVETLNEIKARLHSLIQKWQ